MTAARHRNVPDEEIRRWVLAAAAAADDKKGADIVVLQVGGVLAITDYFLITSAPNTRQVKTIADAVEEGVRAIGGGTTPVSNSSGFSTEVDVEIPANDTVFLGGDGPTILLENLTESLTSSQSIDVTLTFEQAGEVTVRALVANPGEEVERGEAFDFHQEEQEGEADNREVAGGAGQGE